MSTLSFDLAGILLEKASTQKHMACTVHIVSNYDRDVKKDSKVKEDMKADTRGGQFCSLVVCSLGFLLLIQ